MRPSDSKAFAVLNDAGLQVIPGEIFEAFRAYHIQAVPWRQRDQVLSELAA